MITREAFNNQNGWPHLRNSVWEQKKLILFFAIIPICWTSHKQPKPEVVTRMPLPTVNVREFMNTQHDYIWTMNGTLSDECVFCKVEKVVNPTQTFVLFWRNYSFDKITVLKLLNATYGIAREPPNTLEITVVYEQFIIHNQTLWVRPKQRRNIRSTTRRNMKMIIT